ncbi:MAG TPA: hypothetical protein VL983_05240 [Terriglobales bacterium]|nr:hypothetical protein [Terriglobales bacterium]
MSVETRKVLDMLAEGKINAEQADKLLEKLSGQAGQETRGEESSSSAATSFSSSSNSSKPRFLRIVVDKPGQEPVNVRIPLAFARSGSHLLAVLPTRVKEKLAEQGMDFSKAGVFDPSNWENLANDMPIDIDRGNGRKVKIFCE